MRTGAAAILVVAAGALASTIATTTFGAIGRAGQPPVIAFVAQQDHLPCPVPTDPPGLGVSASSSPSAVPCPTATPTTAAQTPRATGGLSPGVE